MKQVMLVLALAVGLAAPLAAAETWNNAPLVDTNCVNKVKADPDQHTRECAIMCAKSGYGILTPDGNYLKFDKAGNEKALAALKATKKSDHLRATVTGERQGDRIKVQSLALSNKKARQQSRER